jgi:tRNA U34 5-carboxymethylaminomethyl modifying GTPase MnmE/TrmE
MGLIRKEETICAPATGSGGAIAVIRISGSQSIDICGKIFFSLDKLN